MFLANKTHKHFLFHIPGLHISLEASKRRKGLKQLHLKILLNVTFRVENVKKVTDSAFQHFRSRGSGLYQALELILFYPRTGQLSDVL